MRLLFGFAIYSGALFIKEFSDGTTDQPIRCLTSRTGFSRSSLQRTRKVSGRQCAHSTPERYRGDKRSRGVESIRCPQGSDFDRGRALRRGECAFAAR